jgi:hypothetical protein
MKDKKLTFDQLRRVLESLGYHSHEVLQGKHIVFRNPDQRLFILLPQTMPGGQVRPIDLLSIRKTLVNDGVIADEDFDGLFWIKKGDRLVWNEPGTGQEIPVTAVAGESDGLVVIERGGVLAPCPVEQLRKESLAARNGARVG